MAFNNRLDFKLSLILTIKLKLLVVMDLLDKTVITPPKIILNSEYLPRNLNSNSFTLDFVCNCNYNLMNSCIVIVLFDKETTQ